MELRMCMAMTATALMLAGQAVAGEGHVQYGCTEDRWNEWRKILSELSGYPREVADATSVRDLNRTLCDALHNGEISGEEALHRYQKELEHWRNRMERRQKQRKESMPDRPIG